MYSGYHELCTLPPTAYLQWEQFGMALDVDGDEIATAQYAKDFPLKDLMSGLMPLPMSSTMSALFAE